MQKRSNLRTDGQQELIAVPAHVAAQSGSLCVFIGTASFVFGEDLGGCGAGDCLLYTSVVGLLSGDVLAIKLLQLNRAERGDRRFLQGFSARWAADAAEVAGGSALAGESLTGSPLSRMYVRGLDELRSALSQSREGRIPGEYLGVIRSALDAGIVEETDALNRRLVMMTIAVSGGPFLGLLGTVVGVMITFASIAATGDVNVNTIAPGIAAALFATVAGLLVAIPSLFGYNFVSSRVSARVSAMEVFADQLVARFSAAFAGVRNVPEATRAA